MRKCNYPESVGRVHIKARHKAIALLFKLMILPLFIQAQTYVPFPDSNAIWREYHAHYDPVYGIVCRDFQNYIKGDTIINGITYRNVWSIGYFGLPVVNCSTYFGDGPFIAYRESNKRIYYILTADPNNSTEYILYDFNLNIGDTCFYPYFNNNFVPNLITQVDSVLIFNSYRRRYFLSSIYSWLPPQLDSNYVAIIEGIGSTYGLLPQQLFLSPNWQEKYDELTCFRHNGNDYSPWGNPCYYLTTQEILRPEPEVKIYPNPAGDFITIEDTEGQYKEIMLMDLSGRAILKENIAGRQLIKSVSLNQVGNGLYMCRITSKSGNRYSSRLAVVK